MSSPRKTLFVFLLLALGLLGLSGCPPSQQDSSIPWSRPAEWEGRIPGMTAAQLSDIEAALLWISQNKEEANG